MNAKESHGCEAVSGGAVRFRFRPSRGGGGLAVGLAILCLMVPPWLVAEGSEPGDASGGGEACESLEAGTVVEVRTTAYTHSEKSHLKYGRKNAVGTNLRFGRVRSAAADWSVFPLGTKFRIEGESAVYVIEDYGSALVGGQTIDLYRPSMKSMRNWGVRHVEIEVIEWGCYEESLKVLVPRAKKAAHVAAMVRALRQMGAGQEVAAAGAPASGGGGGDSAAGARG